MSHQQMLFMGGASASTVTPTASYSILGFGNPGVSVAAQVTFRTDGSVTRFSTDQGTLTAAPWFNPVTASAGDNYWIRFTRTSGNVATNGTEGVWQQLNAVRNIGYLATTNSNLEGHWTAEIAPNSAGTGILGTYSVAVYVDHS